MGGAEIAAVERSGRRLTEIAPLRESGWLWLMRAHAAQGNVAEALMDYEAARKRLSDDVGAAPGRALQAMHAALLADRAPSPGASASLP
jgi:SARP family transcriptional regulator, regulator of embCAB operon